MLNEYLPWIPLSKTHKHGSFRAEKKNTQKKQGQS